MRLSVVVCLVAALFTFSFAEARTWTEITGRTVEADFVGATDTHVTIRRISDRQIFQIELSRLLDTDRAYVLTQLARQAPAASVVETVLTPDEASFEAFQTRLKRFRFGKQSFPAKYLGVMSIVERPIGTLPYHPKGLSIGPDGTIVLSSGNGTTSHMKLVEWTAPGETATIAPLLYKKFEQGVSSRERVEDEREGSFWFFAGQVAHDRNGEILITLGACSDNGIFRVSPRSEKPFRRLNTCMASSSLQVPSWDTNHAYIARDNSITRFSLSGGSAEVKDEIFSIDGQEIYLGSTLMVDRDRIIAGLSLPTGEKDSRGVGISGKFGIYIDRGAGGYYLIHDDYLSPMAISPDGRRMIRGSQDSERKSILAEFSLRAK